jgi:hypothetical protein
MIRRNILRQLGLLTITLLVVASCGLLTAQSWPEQPAARRIDGQGRWVARPFADYRIAVRVEFWGNICTQEIETEGERIRRIAHNDCQLSWLSLMTVARLFEISEGLEHPMPCYAAAQACACYRVKTGEITYDPQLGFPRVITYRREIYPNLVHADYWRRVWQTRRLPDCGPASPVVKITVTSVKPIA